jgi:hypothetical protein
MRKASSWVRMMRVAEQDILCTYMCVYTRTHTHTHTHTGASSIGGSKNSQQADGVRFDRGCVLRGLLETCAPRVCKFCLFAISLTHGYGTLFLNVFTTTCKGRKNSKESLIYARTMHVCTVLQWKRQLRKTRTTRTMSELHAACAERKTHGVWPATCVNVIFVRHAGATVYGARERERERVCVGF